MSNSKQFDHNLQKAKRQREINRMKIEACNYYGQQYDNIKHSPLIVNELVHRYINEVGT